MKNFLANLITFIFAFGMWFLISYGENDFSYKSLAIGILISLITSLIMGDYFAGRNPLRFLNVRRMYIFIFYIPILVFGWIKSAFLTSLSILTNNHKGNAIVKVPTDIKSIYGTFLLSSAISVSPGTLVMDIKEDDSKNYLYVHCTNLDDDIKKAQKIISEEHETWIRRISEK